MYKRYLLTPLALTAILAGGLAGDAFAAVQGTFVAWTGNDANSCSLAAPCRAFGAAILQTSANGEVIVLDSAGYGPATITQPVSIIAPPGIYAGISVTSGGAGMTVNTGSGKVTLRGLTINNISGGTSGIAFLSGTSLYVDNVIVTNFPTRASRHGRASAASTSPIDLPRQWTGAVFNASSGTLTVSIENAARPQYDRAHSATGPWVPAFLHRDIIQRRGRRAAHAGKTANIEVRDSTISDNASIAVSATQTGAASPVNLVSVISSQVSGNLIGIHRPAPTARPTCRTVPSSAT
jgi:hypothetical protein